jgi:hypothetical protein
LVLTVTVLPYFSLYFFSSRWTIFCRSSFDSSLKWARNSSSMEPQADSASAAAAPPAAERRNCPGWDRLRRPAG